MILVGILRTEKDVTPQLTSESKMCISCLKLNWHERFTNFERRQNLRVICRLPPQDLKFGAEVIVLLIKYANLRIPLCRRCRHQEV